MTGQITWHYGEGVCTIDAPQAQGASGFLKKVSPIKLKDVTIQSSNEYATVTIVSLDGKPLKESQSVLVQVGTTGAPDRMDRAGDDVHREMTASRPSRASRSSARVRCPGRSPTRRSTLTIGNPALKTATQLDINGNPTRKLKVATEGGALRFTFPTGTLYVVLEADERLAHARAWTRTESAGPSCLAQEARPTQVSAIFLRSGSLPSGPAK